MTTETAPTPAAEMSTAAGNDRPAVPVGTKPTEGAPIPEIWKPLFSELTTYYRHLPELLAEGEGGRFVVIKGDQVCLTWDTSGDANQYGHERFGDELFMVRQVDPRDLKRLAPYFPATEALCPG
jgi:hypothetical protein